MKKLIFSLILLQFLPTMAQQLTTPAAQPRLGYNSFESIPGQSQGKYSGSFQDAGQTQVVDIEIKGNEMSFAMGPSGVPVKYHLDAGVVRDPQNNALGVCMEHRCLITLQIPIDGLFGDTAIVIARDQIALIATITNVVVNDAAVGLKPDQKDLLHSDHIVISQAQNVATVLLKKVTNQK